MAEVKERAAEAVGQNGDGGGLLSSLMSKEVVIPAVVTAAAAVGLAARKGAGEAKEKVEDEVEHEAEEIGRHGAEGAKKGISGGGGFGGIAGKVASKALGGGGGGGKDGGGTKGKTRRLPIQRWTDVAVPVEEAYEHWTKFEEFPKFMHRVLNVKQEEDDKVTWDEKIWFSSRHWEGEITDRRKNDRIAWKTTSGMTHSGIVSFHRLDKNLTRVMVTMDFVPSGMIEKMASGMRFVKRAVQADLARFKAYVEMGDVEGLEYRSQPEKQQQVRERKEQEQEEKKGEKQDEKADEGDGQEASGGNGDRQERESRREERRSSASS